MFLISTSGLWASAPESNTARGKITFLAVAREENGCLRKNPTEKKAMEVKKVRYSA